MKKDDNVFTFMTLVYNHEEYIIEHLESIKYLVEEYGENYQVDLYINDDASRDNSRGLIESWLSVNSFMFRHVKRFFNSKNLGTCKSVINMLSSVSNDIGICKITAGDDIYSFENIFEVSKINNNYSFLSGIPLHFSDDDLYVDNIEYMGILASQCIYKDRPLIDRFKYLSVSNAPNMFYNTKLLTSDNTLSFLKKFDVVEDWPIQISIAEQNSGEPFLIERKVYVYYRRTKGSAYIVANRRFVNDKIKIYEHLESSACGILERYLISNRKWLFILNNSKLNKIFNLCFYSFLFSLLINLKEVVFYKKSIKIDIAAHNNHLSLIRDKSTSFIDENILV
ncbi:glycosyltransferase [Aeromonas allosaccharophila]